MLTNSNKTDTNCKLIMVSHKVQIHFANLYSSSYVIISLFLGVVIFEMQLSCMTLTLKNYGFKEASCTSLKNEIYTIL